MVIILMGTYEQQDRRTPRSPIPRFTPLAIVIVKTTSSRCRLSGPVLARDDLANHKEGDVFKRKETIQWWLGGGRKPRGDRLPELAGDLLCRLSPAR